MVQTGFFKSVFVIVNGACANVSMRVVVLCFHRMRHSSTVPPYPLSDTDSSKHPKYSGTCLHGRRSFVLFFSSILFWSTGWSIVQRSGASFHPHAEP